MRFPIGSKGIQRDHVGEDNGFQGFNVNMTCKTLTWKSSMQHADKELLYVERVKTTSQKQHYECHQIFQSQKHDQIFWAF